MPHVVGGRYGLSSKEFTPAMVKAVFDDLKQEKPKIISRSVSRMTSHIPACHLMDFTLDESGWRQGLFFGLGADGTVGANKNTIKIIGENTDLYAQGYFVYDSKNQEPGQFLISVRPNAHPCAVPHQQGRFYRLPPIQFHRKSGNAGPCLQWRHLFLNSPYDKGRSME